jgi:hypothetical protein
MSKSDEIKAKGAMLAGGPSQPVPAPRTEKYRLSVDLQPKDHDELQQWATSASSQINWRVPAARVMRVLLRRMLADETLQEAVMADLRALGPVRSYGS